jgi:hypothetical protein
MSDHTIETSREPRTTPAQQAAEIEDLVVGRLFADDPGQCPGFYLTRTPYTMHERVWTELRRAKGL